MLFYFDWRIYLRMLRLGFRETNPAGRRRLLFMLLVVVPVVSTFHAVCFFLDRIFFPGLRRVEVRNPVFIIGHARSGTTLIHRLMSNDGRFSCFLLYELFFPSLIQKKLIRFVGACDRRWLGGRMDAALKRWEARKLAATQDMHRTGLTTPEEDDFLYTFSCASGFWIVLLPYMGELDFYYVDERPPKSRRRMLRFYEECVKRQLYLNGGRAVHLSKNPTFSGRVESLIEAFPDARFVVMLRNPNDTIPSLLKLLKTAWELRRWDEDSIRRSLRVLAAQSFHTYRYPLEALSRHPETKYALRRLPRPGRGAAANGDRRLCAPRLSARAVLRSPARGGREAGTRARDHAPLQSRGVRSQRRCDPYGARRPFRPLRVGRRRVGAIDGRRGTAMSTQDELRRAWDGLLAALGRARDAVDDPRLHPPPPSERNLAEGYRYLLGFLFGAVERAFADPEFPYFRRAIQPTDKATIDNADAIYLCAELAEGTYRVTGRVQDHRHWRGEARTAGGRKAPQYVIFEATTAYAGDSGDLAELSPAVRTNTGTLDSSKLAVQPDGTFEILVAPERPSGWSGNFIPTKRAEHTARYLVVRELFYDWEQEDALELGIVRTASEGAPAPVLDAATAARRIARVGEIVENQMRFWNEFYAIILETYEDVNGDGQRFMPRNAFNAPAAAGIQTGGGQSTNVYAGGVYELADDEAVVVESSLPVAPAYFGFHLSNLWGESLDFANHVSSLNAFQAERDADGAFRYVIAHRDPGIPNWLDTTGLPEGYMVARWTYSAPPEQLPTITATKVPFVEIRRHLPASVRSVSPEERRAQVGMRQRHVQRRYRQY